MFSDKFAYTPRETGSPNSQYQTTSIYNYNSQIPDKPIGAQSEAECRKLITEYNLLNVNR